jgi:hypothetical protein
LFVGSFPFFSLFFPSLFLYFGVLSLFICLFRPFFFLYLVALSSFLCFSFFCCLNILLASFGFFLLFHSSYVCSVLSILFVYFIIYFVPSSLFMCIHSTSFPSSFIYFVLLLIVYLSVSFCRFLLYKSLSLTWHFGVAVLTAGQCAVSVCYAHRYSKPEDEKGFVGGEGELGTPESLPEPERPPLRHIDKYVRPECPCLSKRYTVAVLTCIGTV